MTLLAILLFLPLILAGLIYLPPIQNWAVQKLIVVASEETGMEISLDRIRLTFLLDLELYNLTIQHEGDTLLHTDAVTVDMDFSNILNQQLGIEGIDIHNGIVDSKDLIPQMRIDGRLGLLHVGREDTDLKNGVAILNHAQLDGCRLNISMRDTVTTDTTESSPVPWTIKVKRADITNSAIAFSMPGDSMTVDTDIRKAFLSGGDIRLEEGTYVLDSLGLYVDTLSLCMTDTIGNTTRICLPATSLNTGAVRLDTVGMDLRSLKLYLRNNIDKTQESHLNGDVHLDFNAMTQGAGGILSLNMDASLSHPHLLAIAGDFIPQDITRILPDLPLNAELSLRGNIDSLNIDSLHLSMPSAWHVQAKGYVADAMTEGKTRARLEWDACTQNIDFLRKYPGMADFRLPRMNLSALTEIDGDKYKADALLRSGKGSVHLQAMLNAGNMAYSAKCVAKDMNIRSFLPDEGIGTLSLSAKVKGHGTDIFSKATGIQGEIDLGMLEYQDYVLDNIRLAAILKQGLANVEVICDNKLLTANACTTIGLDRKDTKADFTLSLNRIDFRALGLTEDTMEVGMMLNMDGSTDMRQTHKLNGSIHSMELITKDSVFYPLDITVEVNTDENNMLARANAGNLWLKFHAAEGQDSLLSKTEAIMQELEKQMAARRLDTKKLKTLLPHMECHLLCGDNNPLANFLRSMVGANITEMAFDLTANPEDGLNGKGHMNKMTTMAVLLDSIFWNIDQLPEGIELRTRIKNGPRNKIVNFESTARALITSDFIDAGFMFKDGNGKKGVDLGMRMERNDSTLTIRILSEEPIVAYRKFKVNADNYIALDSANHIKANMDMKADDGTLLKVYSTDNATAEQDVTMSIANFNLGELSRVMPFMPMVSGMLSGDVHAVKDAQQATLSLDMDVDDMAYEGTPLGNIGMDMVYLPNADGSHFVNGVLSQNKKEIILLNGSYWTENEEGQIEAEAELQRLPLNIANGFISGGLARLEGYITGIVDVKGPVNAPLLSGALATDSIHICSDPYSIDLTLPDDTIVMKENFLNLDKIVAYANGKSPLSLDGNVDFRDMSQAKMDIYVVARDFNLINAPKRKGAEAYGKVYVDLFGRMKGTLDNLDIRGRLNVNGKTNVTYVMKDSPMVVDDELASLVTFTDFSDTTETEKTILPEQNIRLDFQVNIDEATTIHCLLSESGQDKIDLEGGGELRLTYDPISGMRMFGRYTVLSGRMDYSLVVVALKNFQIDSGSYVEFMGDMMDPKLSISASERKKASVSNGKTNRSVNFDVGLSISQTLSNLGLEFTLKAPEDITVQNELSSMSVEERGRAAVAMLTTGMYLSPNSSGGGGSFDATSALNSFLNSQISNIAGKALSTIDIGFGIDNTTNATGSTQTDYNFSFAKRFWGNRISVIIGGKVSSGNDVKNTGMSIIDNVSVEYRLDNSGTRYVKAFYNKDTESILDAEVMEMGASLVLRRKTENLGELFIFRNSKKKTQGKQNMQADKNKKQVTKE